MEKITAKITSEVTGMILAKYNKLIEVFFKYES